MFFFCSQIITNPGNTQCCFVPNHLWDGNSRGYDLPSPTFFLWNQGAGAQYCPTPTTTVPGGQTILEPVHIFPQHVIGMALGTCSILANVILTAGVTTSRASTYLFSRVVEDISRRGRAILVIRTDMSPALNRCNV
ncbi:hypothetical protein B0O99DRAFT_615473 [Bisporella sp. PMI_857]|nr:hypothetical protein B0O99DRAFT_615473 [Bisporella sp. PMI_857]